MSPSGLLTERVDYRGAAVNGDDDDDVRGQVETKRLYVLHQLTGEVPGVPLDRQFPDDVGDVTEERDDEVGGCQVADEKVDRRGAELVARARDRSPAVPATQPTPPTTTADADENRAVGGQRDEEQD